MAKRKQAQLRTFRNDLTAEFVKSRLDYDPITGKVFRKPTEVTTKVSTGHIAIKIGRKWYPLHRLIWLMMTGEWPATGKYIDHKNGIPDDNRWENLREATPSENSFNRSKYQSKTGYKGVTWDKQHQKYRAQIMVSGKPIKIGRFNTAKEAHAAYCKAAEQLHGDFARFE